MSKNSSRQRLIEAPANNEDLNEVEEDKAMFPPIKQRSPMRRTLSQIMHGDQPGKKRHSKIQARVYDSMKQQTIKKERPPKPLKRPPLFPVQLKSPKELNTETQEYIRAPVFERL